MIGPWELTIGHAQKTDHPKGDGTQWREACEGNASTEEALSLPLASQFGKPVLLNNTIVNGLAVACQCGLVTPGLQALLHHVKKPLVVAHGRTIRP